MPACAIPPADRRRQIRLVGKDLVEHHGKRKFYSIQQVRDAHRRQGFDIDVVCWSHAFFNSHADFDAHHAQLGEPCDYVAMKRDMVDAVSTPSDSGSLLDLDFDLDLSWLEFPEIDWSIFDFLDL